MPLAKVTYDNFWQSCQPDIMIDFFNDQNTFVSNGRSTPIPDNDPNGIQSTIQVPVSLVIEDLELAIDGLGACSTDPADTNNGINHSWVGDLVIKLKSPAGTEVTLLNREGGAGHNFCDTVLDDEAPSPLSGPAPFSGSFKPSQPLSAFDGENAQGMWTLSVSDNEAQDTGALNACSLRINQLLRVGPGLPVAMAIASPLNPTVAQDTVTLSGGESLFAKSFHWSFVSTPAGSAAVIRSPKSESASFIPDFAGDYVVQLVVTSEEGFFSEPRITTVRARDVAPPAKKSFRNEVFPIFTAAGCTSCHNAVPNPGVNGNLALALDAATVHANLLSPADQEDAGKLRVNTASPADSSRTNKAGEPC